MVEEMEGIATGLCAKLDLITPNSGETVTPSLACNVTEWTDKIQQLNMLPELIRMACTAYGDKYILSTIALSWNGSGMDFVYIYCNRRVGQGHRE
jgi:hypothetical protein